MRLSSSRSTAILHRPQQDFLLWDRAGTRPSLDQQFADRKDLIDAISGQQLITFTRASAGTYVGSDGLIKTATTNEARFDHDPVTGESLGLLVEEQRSNLLLNSGTLATQDVTVAAVAHTLSFYGSGTVTLSGAHTATVVGTGAYPARTTLTFTPTAGTLTVTVSGTVEYANLEIGSFATSYIPTTGSTASRAADVVSITGANFSSWFNESEGSIFCDHTEARPNSAVIYGFANTFDNAFYVIPGSSNNVFSRTTGSLEAQLSLNITGAGPFKHATAYQLNNFAASLNGGSISSDMTGLVPSGPVRFAIGTAPWAPGLNQSNSRIRRLVYWPQRLPNNTLQTITQ